MIALLSAAVLACHVLATVSPSPQEADSVSFVVLGHLRGDRDGGFHYNLDELLSEVVTLEPDFAVLTGDMIWGDLESEPADGDWVVEQWEAFDERLAEIEVPVYRVPGNHDISDALTRDIYVNRYGPLPQAVDVAGLRLLLLSSLRLPAVDAEPVERTAMADLDSAQIAFLREQLADPSQYEHAFVFMHHLLWWEAEDGAWWQEVHPLLVSGGVRAVFTGDYGPQQKFSHMRRDGIDYFQSGIAPDPSLGILRGHEWNRILAQQFDNYLHVSVVGSDVEFDVETIGEISSGHFTPDRWRAVYGRTTRPGRPGGRERLAAAVEHPKIRWLIGAAALVLLFVGTVTGFLVGRKRRRG